MTTPLFHRGGDIVNSVYYLEKIPVCFNIYYDYKPGWPHRKREVAESIRVTRAGYAKKMGAPEQRVIYRIHVIWK